MKIGIIGIGYWGKKVVSEYISLLSDNLINGLVLYDNEKSMTDKFKGISNLEIAGSIDDLLDRVDGVHICSPNATHFEIIMKAMEKNVNVLVEKPITTNSDDAFRLLEIALAKGLVFQVGNIFRFSNAMVEIKKLLDDDTIGNVVHLSFIWDHISPSPSSSNEDVIWDLMPHILDMINFILGSWPREIVSVSTKRGGIGETVNKSSDVLLYYGNNVYINIRISLSSHKTTREIEIQGKTGTIVFNPVAQNGWLYRSGKQQEIVIEPNNTILAEIKNFVECIAEKKIKINSAHLGALIIKEIEAIKRVEEIERSKKV